MTAPAAVYWDQGIDKVPYMTGASQVMDCRDMRDICARLGIELPLKDVLDVGCGTGRVAAVCDGYLGIDISPSAVAYCRRAGLVSELIAGPSSLPYFGCGWVLCLSVFTHINRAERQAYLKVFTECARQLLVDILPGAEGGDVAKWHANPEDFVSDLGEAGYRIVGVYDHLSPQGIGHRYYRCEVGPPPPPPNDRIWKGAA